MSPRVLGFLSPLMAFGVIGCSAFETAWYRAAPPMEPVPVQVSVEQLRAICEGESSAFRSFACARRRLDTRTCLVFSVMPRAELPEFVIHHEEQKHCREGLNHD